MRPGDCQAELLLAIGDVCSAQARMQGALESWKRSANTSRGPATFDDATSARLVRLMAENAKIEVATLEILNEQTAKTEEGEDLPSEWGDAALQVLSDIGGFRPALPELDPFVPVEDGDDSDDAWQLLNGPVRARGQAGQT